MKKIMYSLLAISIVACGGNHQAEETETTAIEICSFSFEADSASVYWEAYKLTDKVGVGGQFDSIVFVKDGSSGDIASLLQGSTIEIFTNSVNSKDVVRDGKLKEFFFQKLVTTNSITGKITSAEGDNEGGIAKAELHLNGISSEQELTYEIKNNELHLSGILDLNLWNGADAITSLNKVCTEKHTGPDGKSILWPDVKIDFFAPIKKTCD